MKLCIAVALALVGALSGCGGDDGGPSPGPAPFQPTQPTLLSTGSPTKDEDPSVILARDGSIVVAWFSDRGGNPDIYITRTTDGVHWANAVRVTTSTDGDFYPNLYQDANGTFHLTWFRWYALNRGYIYYNRSKNPLSWNTAGEIQVTTTADVDDWVPSIAGTPDSLRVFFVSDVRDTMNPTTEIYEASMHVDSTQWGPPRHMTINSPTENDHLPFAAWTGNKLTLVWVRHDTSQPAPWLNPPPNSQIYCAESFDGTTWSSAIPVTNDANPVVNVFPSLYQRQNGEWRLLWLSTRSGAQQIVEFPIANLGSYPTGLSVNTALSPGYSHRVARTSATGVYAGVWVQGPEGAQDIYDRFFKN